MSARLTFLITLLVLFSFPMQAAARDMVLKEPPKSLDKLYPPQSKQQKWVKQMHKMSTAFGGIFINMGQGDWKNAEKHADNLAKAYEDTSKMVPEWEEYFDIKAAKDFAATVKTHDPEKIGKASGAVGKTCGKCHAEHQVAVWTKYHWPSFDNIKLTDPIDEKELDYHDYMKLLSSSFKGITVNFIDGKNANAHKGARVFGKRYMELKSSCSKCHTNNDVKLFFVGKNVEKALKDIQNELAKGKPEAGNVWKNVGIIGRNGCKQCHLTHRAYSKIKDVWETEEKPGAARGE